MWRLSILAVFCLFMPQAMAQSVVTGRVDAPPAVLAQAVNGNVTNLYGVVLGQIQANGFFQLPLSPVDDVDILFVRSPATDDVVLMGLADGDIYDIGVTGTALALLLLSNPANAALEPTAKRAWIKAARTQPDFPALLRAVRDEMANAGRIGQPDNGKLVALLAKIQKRLPR